MIDLSSYISALTVEYPIAGPPARICSLTPVGWPLAYRSEVTLFWLVLTDGLGPSI